MSQTSALPKAHAGKIDTDCHFAKKEAKKLERLRRLDPNNPNIGSSTSLTGEEYLNMPFQGGNQYSSGLKLEYNTNTNKYSLPGLAVDKVFDLVPSPTEAGSMYSEVSDAGYEPTFWPREPVSSSFGGSSHWYGVTQDEDNFYYGVWGGTLFGASFGFGASSIFVARKKKDTSLVWVRNSKQYFLDDTTQPIYTGSTNRIARVALAVYKNRLYVTSVISNIGPQLFCINKKTGARVWSMAYHLPDSMGSGVLVSPTTPFGSVASPGEVNTALGDLNIVVAELKDGTPSVFVGVSSYQNGGLNLSSITGYPKLQDQGHLVRVDDLGNTATRVWAYNTCGRKLVAGDVISNVGNPELNPFRPGSNITYFWRDTVVSGSDAGKFNTSTGANAAILNFTTNPGYLPLGQQGIFNDTTPIITNIITTGSPLTESNVPLVFRSAAPGIGAIPTLFYNVYMGGSQVSPGFLMGPVDITTALNDWNTNYLSAGHKIVLWSYIDQTTVNNVDASASVSENAGVRYIAYANPGYVIQNQQEAESFNYYGNAVWGMAPTIDIARGLIYVGTGQAHSCPVDELLFYQNGHPGGPQYVARKQPLLNAMYQYARPDSSTDGAPFSSLAQVNEEKDKFIADTAAFNVAYNDKSPRGNASYSDAIIALRLTDGRLEFGYRAVPWDSANFNSDSPNLLIIGSGIVDGDVSSGVKLFENVPLENGNYGTLLASVSKSSIGIVLDISGYNPNVVFDNTNLDLKGIVPKIFYSGPDGPYGGANFAQSQDGGSRLIWCGSNNTFVGSSSFIYNTGYYQGVDFHITRDGRVFLPGDSFIASYDVSKGQIEWETSLGNTTHAITSVYNGVVYTSKATNQTLTDKPHRAMISGYNVEDGKLIWDMETHQKYHMAGLNTPSFTDGQAILINNYSLNFIGYAIGERGNKGLVLNVEPCLLTTPTDNLNSLVNDNVFTSYDVSPKAKNPVSFQGGALLNQFITHSWDNNGNLTATHTLDGVDTVLNFKAKDFIYSSNKIVFEKYVTQTKYRYISLRLLNTVSYVLKYQIFDEVSGNWNNYEANFELNEVPQLLSKDLIVDTDSELKEFESKMDKKYVQLYNAFKKNQHRLN